MDQPIQFRRTRRIVKKKRSGRRSTLNIQEQQQLEKDVLTPPRNLINFNYKFSNWTGKTIAEHIHRKFHKTMTSRGAIALIHRLGLKLLRPRTFPAKADKTKQATFLSTFDQKLQTLTSEDHLTFFDACTVQHSATITRTWAKKGQQPTVPVVGGREKMHLIGAIEPAGDKGWFATCPTLGAGEFIGFLKGLLNQYPTGRLYVVLDNARAHHAKRVTEFVTQIGRLELIFLPPYSPDLNPIEDFWRYLRKNVTHNTYYPTFAEFQTAIIEYLTKFKFPQGIIATLCNKYKKLNIHQACPVMV